MFEEGRTQPLRHAKFCIGRADDNDMVVPNKYITTSSHHCYLECPEETKSVFLRDDSSNGTFVNSEKIHKTGKALRWGDRVEIVRGEKVNLLRADSSLGVAPAQAS